MSLRSAALEYAERGFRVGPLHTPDPEHPPGCSCRRETCESEGKHPRTMNGCHDFTTDPEAIRRWWRMWPDANVGIATGGGLVVLDVDPRHGGDESLLELEEAGGELVTLTAWTGGKGLHFYLAGDLPARTAFRPGLDLKGAGGYVVAPPSVHASGRRYEWVDPGEGIRVAPGWLVNMVTPRRPRTDSTVDPEEPLSPRYVEAAVQAECEAVASTAPGNRNNRLNEASFALARFVVAGHAEHGAVVDALMEAAKEAGLPDYEIRRTISSAFNAREAA